MVCEVCEADGAVAVAAARIVGFDEIPVSCVFESMWSDMFSEKHVSLNDCGFHCELERIMDSIGEFRWLLRPYGLILGVFFDSRSVFDEFSVISSHRGRSKIDF